MGCDIHLHMEAKLFPEAGWCEIRWSPALDPLWASQVNFSINKTGWRRDLGYSTFFLLAGVRKSLYGGAVTISPPRGWPANVCRTTDTFDGDHSRSWLSLADFEAFDWTRPLTDIEGKPTDHRQACRLLLERWVEPMRRIAAECEGPNPAESVRVIFCFDS